MNADQTVLAPAVPAGFGALVVRPGDALMLFPSPGVEVSSTGARSIAEKMRERLPGVDVILVANVAGAVVYEAEAVSNIAGRPDASPGPDADAPRLAVQAVWLEDAGRWDLSLDEDPVTDLHSIRYHRPRVAVTIPAPVWDRLRAAEDAADVAYQQVCAAADLSFDEPARAEVCDSLLVVTGTDLCAHCGWNEDAHGTTGAPS